MYSQAHKYFNDFINNNYDINDLFDRFDYKLEKQKMNELRIKALDYIENKINN